ncbi:hypothetical protein EV401DRAFT_1919488 [Pisolithus croceorrhizus]|nr:hypothetical protein EV401DRAFT_1919488 [Pisolithus croceorrhizus]
MNEFVHSPSHIVATYQRTVKGLPLKASDLPLLVLSTSTSAQLLAMVVYGSAANPHQRALSSPTLSPSQPVCFRMCLLASRSVFFIFVFVIESVFNY